jgi:hypothetical protein
VFDCWSYQQTNTALVCYTRCAKLTDTQTHSTVYETGTAGFDQLTPIVGYHVVKGVSGTPFPISMESNSHASVNTTLRIHWKIA